MANTIRIKRRDSSGATGAPTSLKNGELAYNESDNRLYYGYGDDGSGNATSHPSIAGPGLIGNYFELDANNTATGNNTFSGVNTFDTTIYADGGVDGEATSATKIASITNSNIVQLAATQTLTNKSLTSPTITGTGAIAGTFTGNLTGDVAGELTGDVVGNADTATNLVGLSASVTELNLLHSVTDLVKADFTKLADVSANAASINRTSGIGIAEDNLVQITSPTAATPGQLARFTTDGIESKSDDAVKLQLGLAPASSPTFTDLTLSGDTTIAGTLGVTGVTTLGTVSGGTWTATDIAVAHGGTGASTAIAARTNLGVDVAGTDNSTDVTISGENYITYTGQAITVGAVNLAGGNVSGILPAAKVGGLAASKTTSGTFASARLPEATATNRGAIELFSNTDQTVAANAVTTTAGRTYGIQLNAAGQAVVNVPFTRAALGIAYTDTVTFGNITSSGYLRGPSVFTIDPYTHGNDTGKVVIAGDLQVDGTTTTVNSTVVTIVDKNLTLANNVSTLAALDEAGLDLGAAATTPYAPLVTFRYDYIAPASGVSRMLLSSPMAIGGGLRDTDLVSCTIDGGAF